MKLLVHATQRTIHDVRQDDGPDWQVPDGLKIVSVPGDRDTYPWPDGQPSRCKLVGKSIVLDPDFVPTPDPKADALAALAAVEEDVTMPTKLRALARALAKTVLATLLLLGLAAGTAEAQKNFVQNSRFMITRNDPGAPVWPLQVSSGGVWFPEVWRIAPGHTAGVLASLGLIPESMGQGYALSMQWNQYQYVPCLALPQSSCPAHGEFGAGFLEHYIFEFDALVGKLVRLKFWAKVGGCCVGVIPQIQMHYNQTSGDAVSQNEFILPPPVTVTTEWQQFDMLIQLPTGAGRTLDFTRYVALAPTFSGPTAPTLWVARFELTLADDTPPPPPPPAGAPDYTPVLEQIRDLINGVLEP